MVSIIVPVYNVEKDLPGCIEAVLKQTYPSFELLLIDDGSSDGSGAICDRYAAGDSRIRVWHTENCGVSNARNVGLRHARGTYIAFCDADDTYRAEYLEQMRAAARGTAADLVICNYRCKTESGITQPYRAKRSRFVTREEVFERIFLRNEIGGFVWNKLFRRAPLEGLFFRQDMKICEDTYFLVGAMQRCETIFYLCRPLYDYRVRVGSAVNSVRNLIAPDGTSRFTGVFRCILADYPLSPVMKDYVRCGIFWMAASVKCDYKNAGGTDRQIIKRLNRDARETAAAYWKCGKIPLRQKFVTTANWLLNLRRWKRRFGH